MKKFTTIIADDHPIFRNGVRDVLREIDFVDLVGEAKDGAEAYGLIVSLRPEIAILDLEMPLLSGLDVCRKVSAEKHQTKFVLLTMHKEKHFFKAAIDAGAHGYLLKDNAIDDLVKCLESVCNGKFYTSTSMEHFMTAHTETTENQAVHRANSVLSPTEKVILKLVSEAKTSAEIAALLFISVNTVDNHRHNIARKLELEGKNSLIKFAMQHKGQW